MKEYEIISNNIRSIRVKNGLTQDELAKKLQIARETYIDYENKPEKLKVEKLKKIANALNCDLVDFFKN